MTLRTHRIQRSGLRSGPSNSPTWIMESPTSAPSSSIRPTFPSSTSASSTKPRRLRSHSLGYFQRAAPTSQDRGTRTAGEYHHQTIIIFNDYIIILQAANAASTSTFKDTVHNYEHHHHVASRGPIYGVAGSQSSNLYAFDSPWFFAMISEVCFDSSKS